MNTTQVIATPKKGAVKSPAGQMIRHITTGPSANTASQHNSSHQLLIKVTGVKSADRPKMLQKIKAGLPFKAVEELEKAFGTTRKEIGAVLSIPPSTLTRRQKTGRLAMDESDRIARLARLKDAVLAMMQYDNDAAIKWLHSPLEILNDETPMQHASTEMGARDVEDLIGRIQHGVFS